MTKMNIDESKAWFILRGDSKYGPYTYLELIRLLQEKRVYEYDFVWNDQLGSWKKISETSQFKPEYIRSVRENKDVAEREVFFRRRYARMRCGISILIHNNQKVWKGHSLEVGAGGAGMVLETDLLQVGQKIFLHFKAGDGVPPFNAECTVVRKSVRSPNHVQYGVQFDKISQSVQKAIHQLSVAPSFQKTGKAA